MDGSIFVRTSAHAHGASAACTSEGVAGGGLWKVWCSWLTVGLVFLAFAVLAYYIAGPIIDGRDPFGMP